MALVSCLGRYVLKSKRGPGVELLASSVLQSVSFDMQLVYASCVKPIYLEWELLQTLFKFETRQTK